MQYARYTAFTLGIILMLACAFFEMVFSNTLRDLLMVKSVGIAEIPFLKAAVILPLSIIYGIVLIYFTRNGNLGPAFNIFLPINIFIWIAAAIATKYEMLFSNPLLAKILYIWIQATIPLLGVLVWGYANQIYSFRSAALIYPLLYAISLFVSLYGSYLIGSHLNEQNALHVIWFMVAGCGIGIFVLYHLLSRITFNFTDLPKPTYVAWIALFALVFGLEFSRQFPDLFFRSHAKALFETPADYSRMMNGFSLLFGEWQLYTAAATIIIGIILAIFGPKLYLAVGGIILALIATGGLIDFFIGTSVPMSADSYQLFQGGFILNKTMALLFFSIVVQLAYFAFDRDTRFSAKVAVHFIFITIASYISLELATLVATHGALVNHSFELGGLFILGIIISFIALIKIYRMFRHQETVK